MKFLLVLFFSTVGCLAQNATPPVNRPAPEVQLSQLLGAPAGVAPKLAALRGKTVVLEFWATWCGPCVASIPHLNALADQYKGKPVVFLSVSDERAEVVEAFLNRRPMSGWIGIDRDGATFARYGILARPQTILIDARGILRSVTDPDKLNAALIDKAMAGRPLSHAPERERRPVLPMELAKGVPPPLLQVLIRPAAPVSVSGNSPGAVVGAVGGRIEYYGVTAGTMLYYAEHEMRDDRVVTPAWFKEDRYDVSIAVPAGRDDLRDGLLEQAMTAAFSLKLEREQRPVSVYVLSAVDGSKLHVSKAEKSGGFLSHPGQYTGVGTPVSRLANLVSRNLDGIEVIDETGLTGLYDFDLVWQKGNAQSLQTALREQLGLSINKEVRPREFLIVAQAVQPTTQ